MPDEEAEVEAPWLDELLDIFDELGTKSGQENEQSKKER